MQLTKRSGLVTVALLTFLVALSTWKALSNYTHQDPLNSNFFSFWLSGHMVWTGESPYDAAQFEAGFEAYGATYRPSKILQYPLPLMYFMAPIGALPVREAYLAWQVAWELVIAAVAFMLLRDERRRGALLALTTGALLFFGPVYLSLQIGSVGAISLLMVGLAILFLQEDLPIPAGLALSLTLLKPPQALPLLLLAGFWFLLHKQWRVIGGMAAGALALLAVWLIRDPQGLEKFRGSSDFLLGHSMGVQSNVYSMAYLACGRSVPCMGVLGSLLALIVLTAGAYMLWRNREHWDDWEAFNLIIPLAFLCALYLWEYDQILYVIPIVWIVRRLWKQRHSFGVVIGFLIALDAASLVALGAHAYTKQDWLSILNTALVLGVAAWLMRGEHKRLAERSPA